MSLFIEVDTRQIKAIAGDLNTTLVNNTVAIKNAAPDFNTIVNTSNIDYTPYQKPPRNDSSHLFTLIRLEIIFDFIFSS